MTQNQLTEIKIIQPDGSNLSGEADFANLHYKYDEAGNCIEKRFEDSTGNLVGRNSDSIALIRWAYNSNNDIVNGQFFDSQNHLHLDQDFGFARIEISYNKDGEEVEQRRFDANNKVIKRKDATNAEEDDINLLDDPFYADLQKNGVAFDIDKSKWTAKSSKDFDIAFVHIAKILYAGISHEDADMAFDEYSKLIKTHLMKSDPKDLKEEKLTRDGKSVTRFSFELSVDDIPVLFFKDIYKTPSGYVWLVTWIYKSSYAKYKMDIEEFMSCIKFSK